MEMHWWIVADFVVGMFVAGVMMGYRTDSSPKGLIVMILWPLFVPLLLGDLLYSYRHRRG